MTDHYTEAYIGLGSNLQSPSEQVLKAFETLKNHSAQSFARLSPLYQSKAIGPEQPDFVNAVAHIKTNLSPHGLLALCQSIEKQHQRVKTQHWGPRTIDLDILLFGDMQLNSPDLIIPHKEMLHRNFVLVPLCDLTPHLTLPNGKHVKVLVQHLGMEGLAPLE